MSDSHEVYGFAAWDVGCCGRVGSMLAGQPKVTHVQCRDYLQVTTRYFCKREGYRWRAGLLLLVISIGPLRKIACWEVMQLFVHPNFQRRGMGTKLLRAASDTWRQNSWPILEKGRAHSWLQAYK